MQNKETKQEQLSFHTENFRKRSRYTFVFVCMIAAFFVITVLNINTGNVHISVPKILRILFLHDGEAVEYSIIWKIRLPRILMAALLGGALSLSGFLLQTFFSNPDRRTVCTWNFFRSEDGCRTDYDCIFKICRTFFILHISSGSIYRFVDIDGIHSFDVKEDSSYGIPFGRRNHDWIYLFRNYRFCGDICR